MSFQNKDFLLVDYIGKVKETDEVFDTTIEEEAKKANLYKERDRYEAKLVVVGEGWLLKPLEESLKNMKLGKTSLCEIPAEKAFGVRDPNKVKRVSLRHLANKGIDPKIGKHVEYDGKIATVRAIGAGRVLLDFNPPLAGKTLVYKVTIRKNLKKPNEKIKALIHRRIPIIEEEKFKFLLDKTKGIKIEMPEESFYLEGVQVAKRGIALDLKKFFPKMTTITFIETYLNSKKKEEHKEKTIPQKITKDKTTKNVRKITNTQKKAEAKPSLKQKKGNQKR